MRLEDVTAEIRPRVSWESIDLGCALAGRHIGTIWKAWLVTVVPVWIALALLLKDYPIVFILITWWLKPLYDRVPLFVVSRTLFGALPGAVDVIRAWPKLFLRRAWHALVVCRFSFSRSLTLPVSELEGLRGSSYRQRVRLLARNGGEGAAMATFVGLILELVAGLAIVSLVLLMVPGHISEDWLYGIWELLANNEYKAIQAEFLWVIALVRLASFTLMEPFYVAAGFALYVNSRTLTEGWDIELAFKRLGARLEGIGKRSGVAAIMLAAISFLFLAVGSEARAAGEDPAKVQIREILKDEDFSIQRRVEQVPLNQKKKTSYNPMIPPFVGTLMVVMIVLALVAGIGYLIYANRHLFSQAEEGSEDSGVRVREVMGMQVHPESLPDDVVAAARAAWQEGNHQLALSYLYRGSISWLVHHGELPISSGDTESDCLSHVRGLGNVVVSAYFAKLTTMWMSVAYGDRQPDHQAMERLCQSWPFDLKQRGMS